MKNAIGVFIAVLLGMIITCIAIASPLILAHFFSVWWLFLYFFTIPAFITLYIKLEDILEWLERFYTKEDE